MSGADQFNPIAERIGNVATAYSGNESVRLHFDSNRAESGGELVVIRATQSWMCFAGRTEIGFYSQMDLNRATLKPASAAFRQLGRLGDLAHAEYVSIEASGCVLRSCWHRKLHVVDGREWILGHLADAHQSLD